MRSQGFNKIVWFVPQKHNTWDVVEWNIFVAGSNLLFFPSLDKTEFFYDFYFLFFSNLEQLKLYLIQIIHTSSFTSWHWNRFWKSVFLCFLFSSECSSKLKIASLDPHQSKNWINYYVHSTSRNSTSNIICHHYYWQQNDLLDSPPCPSIYLLAD